MAAEVLADQWIPIKPGTDITMMLAVAHVLITEGLYDKEFVEKYVDPVGFEEWRAYVLGEQDGTPKTPEWAERVCAVPAATIRSFARLYASKKPTWLWKGWAVARKSRGENVARAAGALQAIMGYWGVPGGSVPFFPGSRPRPAVMLPYGEIPRRIMPGILTMHHGGWYEPDDNGVDWGCTPNVFLGDTESPVTAPHVTNLVQVETFNGGKLP